MSKPQNILVFEPTILPGYSEESILWKLQLDFPKDYKSIISTLILDNIFLNNRRPVDNWFDFLKNNCIKFLIKTNSKFYKEIVIYDENSKVFDAQILACDVKAADYSVEIESDFVLPLLYILDIKKEGKINPFVLEKKIDNAREILRVNSDNNTTSTAKSLLKYFLLINKLLDHCKFYEHDIQYYLLKR